MHPRPVSTGDPAGVQLAMGDKCAGVAAAFAAGNQLVAVPTDRSRPASARPPPPPPPPLVSVSWETTLYAPIFRKLVNESSQVFMQLQKVAKDNEVVGSADLLRVSRQYRSVIRDCQDQLDSSPEEGKPGQERQLHSELLYKLELIWNLVEVLCVEKATIGIVLPQMLEWVASHFPQADERARQVLEGSPDRPEAHDAYWEAIALFLMQRRKDQALSLLRLHSEFSLSSNGNGLNQEPGSEPLVTVDALASLDEVIRKMPIFSGPQAASAVDFDYRWRHWQREVVSRLDEGDFSSSTRLSALAQMMAGEEQAFLALVPVCETWYQWLCGKLLFQCPDVKVYDLSFHAQKAIDVFGGMAGMTSLDSVLLATMEGDMAQVMHELCKTLDNFWFPAHLLDLLFHADQLDNPSSADSQWHNGKLMQPGPGLREFLLLDYATCLMSHNSLWQLGAFYLDHCPTQGRQRLEALLSKTPLDSERKANKVIALASERGLSNVVSRVCKVMGMKAMKSGPERIGTAMAWAIRSQDVPFTTFLADQLLRQYCESGTFTSADLLDNIGQSMVVSDRLTFLAKYREFHKLCEQGDFSNAASLLHSLMWSRLAPKYFWVTLLIDVIPFINMASVGEAVLSSEQTLEILQCLQELSQDDSLPRKQRLMLAKHEPQIRMHLAKNLAVGLMDEANDVS